MKLLTSRLRPAAVSLLLLFFAVSAGAKTTRATWTTGHKKVLIIPVRFTDFAGPSDCPTPRAQPPVGGISSTAA